MGLFDIFGKSKCSDCEKLKEELEKERLKRFVSSDALTAVADTPMDGMTPPKEKPEEIVVTVMVVNIIGFSRMLLSVGPAQTIPRLNQYLGTVEAAVLKHRGYIDKFLGDQVMAIFRQEAEINHIFSCAIEINEKIKEDAFQKEFPICISVGIATGLVVLGRVGNQRLDFTAIGLPVNSAFLLAKLGKKDNPIHFSGSPLPLDSEHIRIGKLPDLLRSEVAPFNEVYEIMKK